MYKKIKFSEVTSDNVRFLSRIDMKKFIYKNMMTREKYLDKHNLYKVYNNKDIYINRVTHDKYHVTAHDIFIYKKNLNINTNTFYSYDIVMQLNNEYSDYIIKNIVIKDNEDIKILRKLSILLNKDIEILLNAGILPNEYFLNKILDVDNFRLMLMLESYYYSDEMIIRILKEKLNLNIDFLNYKKGIKIHKRDRQNMSLWIIKGLYKSYRFQHEGFLEESIRKTLLARL